MRAKARAPERTEAAESAAVRGPRVGLLRQLLRFGLTGALAGIIDYSGLQLLIQTGLLSELAKTLSYVLGSTVAYLINRIWTFPSQGDAREKLRVTGAYGLALCLNVSAYAALRYLLPHMPWKITVCWLFAQVLATTCNFLLQRDLVFRRGRESTSPRTSDLVGGQ